MAACHHTRRPAPERRQALADRVFRPERRRAVRGDRTPLSVFRRRGTSGDRRARAKRKVQFTVGSKRAKLRVPRILHSVPNGDPAEIFDRALTLLVDHLERTKFASTARPRQSGVRVSESRYIPSSVKRSVWTRDGGRCAFEGGEGRCGERGFLEYHHVIPYADGGAAREENIQLRCRAHNRYEADQWFGGGNFLVRERPPSIVYHRQGNTTGSAP